MALVNFYKGSYDSEALLNLCKTQGNIVFDNNTSRIYVGTVGEGASEAPKIYGSNVVDATFVNNVLTITRLDSEQPVTLDFSDVASAKSLMAVFDQLKRFMGMSTGSSSEIAPNYSSDSTGILYNTSTSTANAASLVEADLALAAAIANSDQVDDIQINGTTVINNKIANFAVDGTYNPNTNKIATESTVSDVVSNLDAVADADNAGGTGYATVTTTTPSTDFKVLNSVTEIDGKLSAAEAYSLKKVAATAESADLFKSTNSTSNYDTTATEISSSWTNVIALNSLADGDTVDADLNKLDNKIAGLADEVIRDERIINTSMAAVTDSVGLEDNFALDLSGDTTGIISSDTSVKNALLHLASNINDTAQSLDSVVDADDTSAQTGHATITVTTPSADFKVLNSVTEQNGVLTAGDAYQLKKVAATAESADLFKTSNSTATYDAAATEISSTWVNVINSNTLADGDTVDADLNKLDNKIAGLADEVIRDERIINTSMAAVTDSVGLEDDFSLSLTGTGIIGSDTDVKSALVHLAGAITGMDSTATIATKNNNTIILRQGLVQVDGVVENNDSDNISLADVAATGAASDVSVADAGDHFTATNVEGALTQLATAVEALSGSFDVIVASDAATTPAGVVWDNSGTTVTGTLAASGDTFHKVYLVRDNNGSGKNTCAEYITVKTTSGSTVTYSWEKLGDIDVDLTGYVKSVTVNGKVYQVDANTTNITLTDLITAVTGETAISGGDSSLVAVTATTTKNTTTGANTTAIASSVKVEEVADGLTKDSTATYQTGHYIIQNGKLVDASSASSGDTYTISANDGLTKASDVKAYVDSTVQNARLTWAQWS